MFKKILCLLLCLMLCLAVGCSNKTEQLSVDQGEIIEEVEEPQKNINPLTGIADLDPENSNIRPIAITVNNINVAQSVQTGLNQADIVYETEVEGGITRLLAVYQDITKVSKIGSVRSARYVFLDLALGHNAVYCHHGEDYFHVKPRFTSTNHYTVSGKNDGARISNGLASEHTLYAYGDKLFDAIKDKGIDVTTENNENWVNFADEDEKISLENTANSVKVPFSNSYITNFKFNQENGKYTRFSGNTERKDYVTNESVEFKNIFVLETTIRTFANCTDGKNHKDVSLTSGNGYYLVNGTYTPIKWSKGSAQNGFEFTLEDGSELTVNAGNSWVCLVDSSANITFE